MADNTQVYTTRIFLNSEEAKKRLDELQGKVDELRKKRDAAAKAGDWPTFNNLKKQLDSANNEIRSMQTSAQKVDKVLGNLSVASVKDLRQTIRAINRELESGAVERGSEEWNFLNQQLRRCKDELRAVGKESASTVSAWGKFTGFLNKNWGAITQMFGAISGVSMTVRKSVEDFAKMEEEMADVRKYTGMTTDSVRELNDELKRMDTRTSRENLNQLAGAAGRLGLQAKDDVMEFVEAADMIGVALGDDLGDGAVDKIGKLAMAFGEDENRGLKQAMLSTGSAINELAQNSSANAGYLVDYTARVAGFGKQLGLTQAQIMGFGAVMDENLLQDEMAATAFGNMLTRMQTDTAKFANIAGMDIKAFTDLLNKDANQAILTLADRLNSVDGKTMMKMLDDMGLDGARAVAVLATMADKIDDVRRHQQRAAEAYEAATSVQNEFNVMNTTVQARLEKCRKAFHETAVELGERLLPVVQYTITGASLMARTLSFLTGFIYNNWRSLAVLTGYVAALTVAWEYNTIVMKANIATEKISAALKKGHAFLINTLRQAYVAWRIVIATVTANQVKLNLAMAEMKNMQMTNIWTALITVVLTASVAIYGAVKAWNSHREAVRNSLQEVKEMRAQQQLTKDMNEQVSKSVAQQRTRVEQLTRIIRSNAYSVDERRKAVVALQRIIPSYHASITNEGVLYKENSEAIRTYIKDLNDAAMAEAIYTKKVEINGKKLELMQERQRIEGSLKAVQAYRDTQQQTETTEWVDADGRVHKTTSKTASALRSDAQQRIHEQRLRDNKSEMAVLESEDRFLDQVQQKDEKIRKHYAGKVIAGNAVNITTPSVTPSNTTYTSADNQEKDENQLKREERERLREAENAAKAESDARIAAKTHEYAMGRISYRQYIQDLAELERSGLEQRRNVYQQGSKEYEQLNRQIEELDLKGSQKVNQMKLEDLTRGKVRQQAVIEAAAVREEITEAEKQERLRLLEETFLADKVELYQVGSKERMDAEWELEQTEQRNRLQREQYYQQQLEQVREQYLGQPDRRMMELALKNLDDMHAQGLLKEQEYQEALLAVKAQFAEYETQSEHDQRVGADALKVARNAARQDLDSGGSSSANMPITGDIMLYQSTMDRLKQMYQNDEITHAQYLAAKQQATAQFCATLASQMQAAYNAVEQVLSAASSYFSAQQEYETAQVQKKYERQIEAASGNQKKITQLQERQQKEEAAIKNKYAKRAATIQMAQAVAQTAIGAINAYSSAVAIPVVGPILAPVAAAKAIAAGMLQIATIKKQQQAQSAGYYEGGFTGGRRYRKEAGVVHEGEFVANHQAVQNPNVVPFLNFIDQAQRNNTVGSLTMQDITRQIGAGGSAQVVAPVVNVQTDNEQINNTLQLVNESIGMLNQQLTDGINATVAIDGPQGLHRQYSRYLKMNERV